MIKIILAGTDSNFNMKGLKFYCFHKHSFSFHAMIVVKLGINKKGGMKMSRKTRKVWMIINLILFIILSALYLPTVLEGNKIHLLIYILFSIGLLKDVFLWKKENHSD